MRIAILDCTATHYNEELSPNLPLGGIERCIISLSRAFYNKGMVVHVYNKTLSGVSEFHGIPWAPLNTAHNFKADVVIACNDACLFDDYATSSGERNFKRFLWLHNPVNLSKTIRKGRFLPLLRWRPEAIFLGTSHIKSTSAFVPFGRKHNIGHGVEDIFLNRPINTTPPAPHAAFISQSYRGLDDVIRIWKNFIFPKMPQAKLDIYSEWNGDKNLELYGITLKGRLPRAALLSELSDKRVMLIPGHKDETFCLAAQESLCLGIPVITFGIGSLKERIENGTTGYIAKNESEFAAKTLTLLSDDTLWTEMHNNAAKTRDHAGWGDVAEKWLGLLK
jgi:glycosyltransferase involved in cell wall biosynthesis